MVRINYYVEEGRLLNLTFGTKNSREFKMIITETNHLEPFERDYELTEVPGRTGDLLTDNGRKKNKIIKIVGYIDCEDINKTVDVVKKEVELWLLGKVEYRSLRFSDVSDSLSAICEIKSAIEELEGLLKYQLEFNCKESVS